MPTPVYGPGPPRSVVIHSSRHSSIQHLPVIEERDEDKPKGPFVSAAFWFPHSPPQAYHFGGEPDSSGVEDNVDNVVWVPPTYGLRNNRERRSRRRRSVRWWYYSRRPVWLAGRGGWRRLALFATFVLVCVVGLILGLVLGLRRKYVLSSLSLSLFLLLTLVHICFSKRFGGVDTLHKTSKIVYCLTNTEASFALLLTVTPTHPSPRTRATRQRTSSSRPGPTPSRRRWPARARRARPTPTRSGASRTRRATPRRRGPRRRSTGSSRSLLLLRSPSTSSRRPRTRSPRALLMSRPRSWTAGRQRSGSRSGCPWTSASLRAPSTPATTAPPRAGSTGRA